MATTTATTTETDIGLTNLKLAGQRITSRSADVTEPELTEPSNHGTPCPDSYEEDISVTLLQINTIKRTERIQFTALCLCLFLSGYNDGTTGPLLPTIQRHYHVNFAIVSILFVGACIGFVAGGLLNVYFTDKFGFGKTIVLGGIGQVAGYAIMAPAPPFPVLVIGYVVNGFGTALQGAQANGFVAALKDSSAKMNFLHAAYGLGAMSAPLIATQFAQLPQWSFHYLTSLGIACANLGVQIAVFKLQTQNAILMKNGHPSTEVGTSQHSAMRQILGIKVVHLLAFFILVYVGTEVTIGGWIVTFIINKRGGGPSAGYISTGFFGGLTVGRLVLHYATRIIPEGRTIFLYGVLSIGLELTIWLIPSLIGNAVSVSLIGFFLGPMYPSIMNQAGFVLPQWLLTGSIGWIAGFGQAGSAVIPFITGALANNFGINSLQPLLVSAMVLMVLLWAILPKGQRRLD